MISKLQLRFLAFAMFISVCSAFAQVNVTFQVDMSAVDTHTEGVYLAGGPFGQEGHLLADNGSDVWSVTLELD
ncbi:MAG: hypothetical protein P8I82_07820, partial [Flavobacteriales bacterium]|nr:hypothetical protein [Flavobacteriales bacterium]